MGDPRMTTNYIKLRIVPAKHENPAYDEFFFFGASDAIGVYKAAKKRMHARLSAKDRVHMSCWEAIPDAGKIKVIGSD